MNSKAVPVDFHADDIVVPHMIGAVATEVRGQRIVLLHMRAVDADGIDLAMFIGLDKERAHGLIAQMLHGLEDLGIDRTESKIAIANALAMILRARAEADQDNG